jgi:hypothetical protein
MRCIFGATRSLPQGWVREKTELAKQGFAVPEEFTIWLKPSGQPRRYLKRSIMIDDGWLQEAAMKKWLVTASIIVVAGSALCLPVRAEPKNERVPSAPSFEAWWIDIGARRASGTVPAVKLGELNGSGLFDSATMSMVTPAGASRDPALFSPFATGTKEAPAVPIASLEDDRDLTARSLANLYLRGVEKLSIAYAFDGVGTKDLTDVVTDDPRPLAFQGPIGDAPLVAQDE